MVALVVTPVGKRVFLRVVATVTTVMRGMTPAATTVNGLAKIKTTCPNAVTKSLICVVSTVNIRLLYLSYHNVDRKLHILIHNMNGYKSALQPDRFYP